MKTFIVWLLVSSKDPDKLSLFVKGFLGTAVSVITIALQFSHVQVGDLTPVIDAIVAIVQALAVLISAVAAFWGLVRKIWLTIQGEHAGLNTYDVR